MESEATTLMSQQSTNEGMEMPWWKRTTVYQIYPRSFSDSSGNGIGDLQGIIQKLDYLQDLGIETIWFSPFYASPQADFGYDIADYRAIAPEYGTMEDCDQLIREIHARGMKILVDMVMNHTSDQHPWFLESKQNRTNPKRDWYIWRDGKKPGGKAPPNQWRSKIGTNGWHYDASTDQWYWSAFLAFQPDLNFRNPEVKQEMLNTVRFWLDKGVDGFRLDIIDALYEDEQLRDNKLMFTLFGSEKKEGFLFQSTEHTVHHPDTIAFARELRQVLDEYSNPPRYMVGEVFGPLTRIRQYCGETQNTGLHSIFLFSSRNNPFKADAFRKTIETYEAYFPPPFIPTWVFSNHDYIRRISDLDNNVLQAKLQACFQMTVRGIPFIYYGEEIGIPQGKIPFKESKDAVSFRFQKYPKFICNLLQKLTKEALHRDNCRTPMQWSGDRNAGFCVPEKAPWLPVSSKYATTNVAFQQSDPNSLLQCYQRLLRIRKAQIALNAGTMRLVPKDNLPKNVLGYFRETSNSVCLILLNFDKHPVNLSPNLFPESAKLLFSTEIHTEIQETEGIPRLGPWEGVIFHFT